MALLVFVKNDHRKFIPKIRFRRRRPTNSVTPKSVFGLFYTGDRVRSPSLRFDFVTPMLPCTEAAFFFRSNRFNATVLFFLRMRTLRTIWTITDYRFKKGAQNLYRNSLSPHNVILVNNLRHDVVQDSYAPRVRRLQRKRLEIIIEVNKIIERKSIFENCKTLLLK